ncbi:MAG TPA: hypothetical protein VFK04_15570 [Gemmatimonadaceae bacterium]|nr:hypothetical protein [Gemmatimonadaceae bacterium]
MVRRTLRSVCDSDAAQLAHQESIAFDGAVVVNVNRITLQKIITIMEASMRRPTLILMVAFVSGCGVPLPMPHYRPIQDTDPGYEVLKLQMALVDKLSISDQEKLDAKALLTTKAALVTSLNAYDAALKDANQRNQHVSSAYSWTNGVVGGLGAGLAAVDSKRDWGPVAGAVGAIWNLIGLALQKVFVDPKVADGTSLKTSVDSVGPLMKTADDAWESMRAASSQTVDERYTAWSTAIRAANLKAAGVLDVLQQLNISGITCQKGTHPAPLATDPRCNGSSKAVNLVEENGGS